jgi:hypothetical protein
MGTSMYLSSSLMLESVARTLAAPPCRCTLHTQGVCVQRNGNGIGVSLQRAMPCNGADFLGIWAKSLHPLQAVALQVFGTRPLQADSGGHFASSRRRSETRFASSLPVFVRQ